MRLGCAWWYATDVFPSAIWLRGLVESCRPNLSSQRVGKPPDRRSKQGLYAFAGLHEAQSRLG